MVHTFMIAPSTYIPFDSEDEQIQQCKEWGLLSEKASKTKHFAYKGGGLNTTCSIVGYVDKMTAVLEFDNKQQHCIHPSYLKEMQTSSFGARQAVAAEESSGEQENAAQDAPAAAVAAVETAETAAVHAAAAAAEADASVESAVAVEAPAAAEPKKKAPKKEKAPKLQLPVEKVKMTATVKEFTTVPNNFTEEEDEVIIYEAASIAEPAIELGEAWSSYSATLKKLELEIGQTLTFECKIVEKKLTKHPVRYKINNPSKLQKL
ncbi:hypothetical protein A8990_115121 [Paenibacillus taihuensis]|uniref:Uncharacterized protein n=1 Tax=Paenibacillus taihuensis TaxID=1156355 RepID=A0A3D9S7A8_9BACL|nr:hypothetical protein [Paenibacillus taihuensis]REE84442.1 hypothetical protein A8990_115121 [Paenibacillus taihuensis]